SPGSDGSGMELITEEKKGYKKTEVGMIPEDWVVKQFGEITQPSKLKVSKEQITGKYPCVELEHIKKDIGSLEGYSNLQNQKSLKTQFSKGDVLFGKLRPYLKKYYLAEFNGACSTEIWVFNTVDGFSNKYLFYLVQQDRFIDAANKSTGTHMPRADWNVIQEYPIPLPPTLAEQQAIASALFDVDELIRSLDTLVQKKDAIKKGTMQQLLSGNKRLPGFDGEWEVKRLDNIGNTFNGLTGKKKADFGDGNHSYITFLNVMNNTVVDTSIFDFVVVRNGEFQSEVKQGDLLFNTSSETPEEVGMCAVLLEEIENLHLNSFCFGFRLSDKVDTDSLFLAYYFR
ncbi:MAG: restriction endonuclease subunit S, partial [Candidatus Paceibacterota bacterium]